LSVDGSPSSQAKATDVELYEHIGTHSQVEVGIAVAAGYTTINEVIDMTGFVKPTVRSNLNVLHKTNVISKSDSEDGSSKKLYTAQEPPQERILGEYLTRHAALLGQVA